MKLKVNSSRINYVDYDYYTHTLIIEFSRGGTYTYENVEEVDFDAFLSNPSPGRGFNASIRDKYKGIKQ